MARANFQKVACETPPEMNSDGQRMLGMSENEVRVKWAFDGKAWEVFIYAFYCRLCNVAYNLKWIK